MYPDLPKWIANQKKTQKKASNLAKEGLKAFVRWTEVEPFSKLRTTLSRHPELPRQLTYRGKIKLHGTNAAVVLHKNGAKVYAQRRNGFIPPVLTKDDDTNFDFGPFVYQTEKYWKAVSQIMKVQTAAVFGEWCGRGICKGAAVCTLPTRHFAVFCIQINGHYVLHDPNDIRTFLQLDNATFTEKFPGELLVLPYISDVFSFDFSWTTLSNQDPEKLAKRAILEKTLDQMNDLIKRVDKQDPFILATFGVDGVGEGVVFYPDLPTVTINGQANLIEYDSLSSLIFKAKGKTHRGAKVKEAATLEADIASTIGQYVDMFVTDQRCEQGLIEACKHVKEDWTEKDLAAFVAWMSADVKKESKEEIGTLDPSQADSAVRDRASKWFEKHMILAELPNATR